MISNAITSYGHSMYDDDDDDSDDSFPTDDAFCREVNRTRASYQAFNHAYSKVDALVPYTADGFADSDQYDLSQTEYREEMVRDLIERKATACKDAVVFASVMKFRRQLIEEEMQFEAANAFQSAMYSQRLFDFQHRLDVKRMHNVLLKGGLLGLSNIMRSFLPEEAPSLDHLQVEKHVQSVMLNGEFSGLSDIIKEHLAQGTVEFEHHQQEGGMLLDDDSDEENFYKTETYTEKKTITYQTNDLSETPDFLLELQNKVSTCTENMDTESSTDVDRSGNCDNWSNAHYLYEENSDGDVADQTDDNERHAESMRHDESVIDMEDSESVSMESITVESVSMESITVEIYSERKMQHSPKNQSVCNHQTSDVENYIENYIENENQTIVVSESEGSDDESHCDNPSNNCDGITTAEESAAIMQDQNDEEICNEDYSEINMTNMNEGNIASRCEYYSDSDDDSMSTYDMDNDSTSSADNNEPEGDDRKEEHSYVIKSSYTSTSSRGNSPKNIKSFQSEFRGTIGASSKFLKSQPYHHKNSVCKNQKKFAPFNAAKQRRSFSKPGLVRQHSASDKRKKLESQWISSTVEPKRERDTKSQFEKNRKKFSFKSELIKATSGKNNSNNRSKAFKSKILSASSFRDGEKKSFKSELVATTTTKLLQNDQKSKRRGSIKNSTYLRQNKFIQLDVTCKRKARQRQFELKWTETTSSSVITYKEKPDNRKVVTSRKMQQMESKWKSTVS